MGQLTISMAMASIAKRLPEGKPPFSYGFPMVFPLKPPFSYGFPMVYLGPGSHLSIQWSPMDSPRTLPRPLPRTSDGGDPG